MMGRTIKASVLLAGVLATASMSSAAIIVDDKFADGGISNGADAKDVNWVKTINTRPVAPAYTSNFGTSGNSTGALNFVSSNAGGADYKNSAVVKGSFTGTTLSYVDPATSTIKLSFDFRYTGNTGGTATSSTFRFGLGTASEGHAFQFSNAASASNPGLTIYDDVDKLSGTAVANLGGKSPGVTVNDTTTSHSIAMSIERTGASSAKYSVSIDGSAPWTWTLAGGVSDFTFDRVLLSTGTESNTGVRASFVADNVLVEVVPEPGALGLIGLATVGILRRRRAVQA